MTLTVLHIITSLGEGGAEAVLTRLCRAAQGQRHVVVSLLDAGKYGPELEAAGVTLHCLDMPRGRLTGGGLLHLWQLLRRTRPDVVQTWLHHADLVGGIMARLATRAPVVWNLRNTAMPPGDSPARTLRVVRLCGRLSRIVPARIVACGQAAAAEHRTLGYDAARMEVIPNGYDLSRWRPDPALRTAFRRELGVGEDVPLLGLVARFDPQKDHATLIRALGHLRRQGRDFRAILVGRGVDAGNGPLTALLAQEGIADITRLHGPLADVRPVMNALDLHVMSSAFGEGFPNVLAEAMACGTPVISTDTGAAREIVGDTGWIVPPGAAPALATAIAAALDERRSSPAAWAGRRAAARARIAAHHTLDTMVDAYARLWEDMAKDRRG